MQSKLVSFDPATGVVKYDPFEFRFLGEGETAVYKFKFTSASGVGSSLSDTGGETLLLTVTGTNDAPVFDTALVAVNIVEVGDKSAPCATSANGFERLRFCAGCDHVPRS